MRIRIASRKLVVRRGLLNSVRTGLAERLGRFGVMIASVSVELSDRNGRRGGGDKRCRIFLSLTNGGRIVCEDKRANLRVAIRGATDRLEHAVRRAVRVPAM